MLCSAHIWINRPSYTCAAEATFNGLCAHHNEEAHEAEQFAARQRALVDGMRAWQRWSRAPSESYGQQQAAVDGAQALAAYLAAGGTLEDSP